jgi:hypothetical protein
MNPLVVIESPFAGPTAIVRHDNLAYARRAVKDSLDRGEAPIASHLLYTQPGILDDNVPEERTKGIDAGLAWLDAASYQAVYLDRGISLGMLYAIQKAREAERRTILRTIERSINDLLTITADDCLLPGGELAVMIGCSCPRIDNHHGRRPRFVMSTCYLHGGRNYADVAEE